jgi:hypothetical protein
MVQKVTNARSISTGTAPVSGGYSKQETDAKFKDVNYVLTGVIVILLVMVATLLIDSFHINSATYKEYSNKIDDLNTLRDSNRQLFEQNRQNQELILKQQDQIMDMLTKQHGSTP